MVVFRKHTLFLCAGPWNAHGNEKEQWQRHLDGRRELGLSLQSDGAWRPLSGLATASGTAINDFSYVGAASRSFGDTFCSMIILPKVVTSARLNHRVH